MTPLRSISRSLSIAAALVCASCPVPPSAFAAQQDAAAPSPESAPVPLFKTNVRRVVLDVVVTDSHGKPVAGLTKQDFSVSEDNKPQQVLSFDTTGFDASMDYMPPKLPPQPPNTFVNLPPTPEKGPLYVLLYDLVNMDNPGLQLSPSPNDYSVQMTARQQMVKFIQEKPEGARFCIFVWSDSLHLIQGFTSDKAQLLAAVDPNSPRAHIPRVFMMGQNYGRGETQATLSVIKYIAEYLDGLPGRKNLIWFSGGFPLSLFASDDDPPSYAEEVKTTLDKMAQDQIAIYPVDASGVMVANPHAPTGATGNGTGMSSDSRDKGIGGGSAAAAAASQGTTGGDGFSMVSSSYMIQDEIAQDTGGRSFHSNNDLAGALLDSTEDGSSFYTLTYSPSNPDYSGAVRKIKVELDKKGYTLSYRRAYYGTDFALSSLDEPKAKTAAAAVPPPPRKLGDTLYANMEHGAPIAHQLIFGAHLAAVGHPAMGTVAQMAELATQPAYFKVRRRSAQPKPLAPIPLQRYAIDFTVMAHQLQLSGAPLNLELAAAAYDADGRMLNAMVSNAEAQNKGSQNNGTPPPKAYRAQQQLDVPLAAAWIRVAVRDANTNRIGAMEIKLPLAPENETATATPGKPN